MKNKAIKNDTGKLPVWAIIVLIIAPVLCGFLSLCIGRMSLSPADVWNALVQGITGKGIVGTVGATVINIRLKRVVLCILCGAGLSASGLVFQSLFANPLATPDTVGVAGGSSFGAALGILLGGSTLLVQGMSFFMGLAAVALTWMFGRRRDRSLSSVVLSGIMVGSLFSALLSLVRFLADSETELPSITYFLMGSLANASYKSIFFGAIPILFGIILLFAFRWKLNLLPYSEDEVRSLGVNLKGLRLVALFAATLMTASCVSLCGQVGWVGLLVPHFCRMKLKNNHLSLLPAVLSVGAVFMIIVDTLARSISTAEIPVSVLTAIIGAPFFFFLMRKTGGWRL